MQHLCMATELALYQVSVMRKAVPDSVGEYVGAEARCHT